MISRRYLGLTLVFACALAQPAAALAAPASLTGPATVAEGAGVATYSVECGDTPNPLSTPLTPLPPIPNTGPLAVTVTDGPAPAAGIDDRGIPTSVAITCPASGPVSFDVPIANDTADEPDEAFTVTVSGSLVAEGAVSHSVVTTITDDDLPVAGGGGDGGDGSGQPGGGTDGGGGAAALPALELSGTRVKEGDSGLMKAVFELALSKRPTSPVEVTWSTRNGSANLADYMATHGTLVFGAGETAKTVLVNVKGDLRDELAEDFAVVLGTPKGATLANAYALGTITDDDGPRVGIGRPTAAHAKALRVPLSCPAVAEGCKGTLTATAGRLKLGRARFDLAKGAHRALKLKLSRKARKALQKRARRVNFAATATDPSGGTRLTTRKLRVRRLK